MKIDVLGLTLDKEQTKAATLVKRNSIIIAGAGSGKSLTMVGKVKYLVQEFNIPIEEILCITFTNNAAKSLEEKIKKELGIDNNVYTFHKLALKILNDNFYNYKIASYDLLDYIINEIFYSIHSSFLEKYFCNKNYLESEDFDSFKKVISRFIRLFINNYYKEEEFKKIINKAKKKDENILKLIEKIYQMYILEKEASGLIDFDDMIYMATKIVYEKGIKINYKYIIIDEYQDTSKIREDLVQAIIKKTKAFITVVGDDFQSIYRFSGCDISYFIDFKKRFSHVKKLFLTSTYRNSQELITVAGNFVMENKRQIAKILKSHKRLTKPIIIFYYNKKTDIKKAIDLIPYNNILILGRNNYDVNDYLNGNLKHDHKNITFKTIHKAKGLEEECVLIINLTNDTYSLPSKVKDDYLLKYVTIHKDYYPFEEERRLFYVALTRTKNCCYLFVPKKNPSIFVEELLDKYKKYIDIINL